MRLIFELHARRKILKTIDKLFRNSSLGILTILELEIYKQDLYPLFGVPAAKTKYFI